MSGEMECARRGSAGLAAKHIRDLEDPTKSGLLGREYSESGREYLGYSNGVHFEIVARAECSSFVRRVLRAVFVSVCPTTETHARSLALTGPLHFSPDSPHRHGPSKETQAQERIDRPGLSKPE
jgi:hypothetical protein